MLIVSTLLDLARIPRHTTRGEDSHDNGDETQS